LMCIGLGSSIPIDRQNTDAISYLRFTSINKLSKNSHQAFKKT
jgi:hypothetical protein